MEACGGGHEAAVRLLLGLNAAVDAADKVLQDLYTHLRKMLAILSAACLIEV